MTRSPLRVAFAGLAHSHPYTDAANVRALGAEVVGVHDADAAAATAFAASFGGAATASVGELLALRPDLVIATPRPHEVAPVLRALGAASAPVFVNKVIAATADQLGDVDRALASSAAPIGTSSVLRFAPALVALAAEVDADEVLGLRVHAQHDNAAFQLPDRSWQDDPLRGGGTLVTVGVHAWEMLDVVLPGAVLVEGSGWTRVRSGSGTASEDAAGFDGTLRLPGAQREVPVQALVTGVPGPDVYTVDVITHGGIRSVALDGEDANDALGFRGLIRALLDAAAQGATVAAWSAARVVVANTIRAAEIARGVR
ncbi:Gfo/Idh/MocA family oxidoreductase [Microbacterium sp. NPDC090218]